jgi:hypothetical protein
MKNAYLLMLGLHLTACMKEELPVPAATRGATVTLQECLGPGYQNQLWIDLGSGSVVGSNTKEAWDLAFESGPDAWRVWLNGARLMTAWDLGTVDIAAAHDTVGMFAGRRIDAPSGHPDSTAIGDWRGRNAVFLVDMGYNSQGQSLGFRKFRFRQVSSLEYVMDVASLDGSQVGTVVVPKDPDRHRSCYRIGVGAVHIEPQSRSWDLVLTHYTHQFYDPVIPYLVVGLLSAPDVRVAQLDDRSFDAVQLTDTLQHPFNAHRDAIGYDWKDYSFEEAAYTVEPRTVYIVQDGDGYFFKLNFLDFYGAQGQVGCPLMQVAPL